MPILDAELHPVPISRICSDSNFLMGINANVGHFCPPVGRMKPFEIFLAPFSRFPALKVDRKRLKEEKFDLLNQMKQLYQTLEDKENELRDFIRNYEQVSPRRAGEWGEYRPARIFLIAQTRRRYHAKLLVPYPPSM